jgi:DNA polymerase-3 subunit gamma/tau
MSYVVLARKWRPQTFDDLVGQEHVSRTLSGAIASGRVAHAFLFTGVRGVGKTTSARILARALNCEKGPTVTPCLSCPPCVEIGEGVALDVQEIDGASYTGVDAVRQLQETIPYRPARDRFKIFIVDEVHMLSTAAWNAFLKTLEEPPPHVKFIFATTEVAKVPVTILSRCQRYDFKLIRADRIAARLEQVVQAEGVRADDEAIRILAREAGGSMRDAMSLLDQVVAWVGDSTSALTAESVGRILGVAARSVHHRLAGAVLAGDPSTCLDVVAELAEQGFGLQHVARDFLSYLRDLVVARASDHPRELLEMPDAELADLRALAEKSAVDDLSRIYLSFSRAFDDVARSAQPRGAFEMALVRLARRPPMVPIDELLERLSSLERRVSSRGPAAGGSSAPPASGGAPQGRPHARPPGRDPSHRASGPAEAAPNEVATAAPVRPMPPHDAPRPLPPPASSSPPPISPPASEARPQPRALDDSAAGDWAAILERVARHKPHIASVFAHAAPLGIGRDGVVLGLERGSFLADQAATQEARDLLTDAASEHFGTRVAVEIDLSGRHGERQTLAARHSAEAAAQRDAARQRVREHPLVKAAQELLGAELRDVRLPGEAR